MSYTEPYPNEEGHHQHSYRYFSPDYIEKLWKQADDHREEARVRATLKHIEDGRFYEMLDSTHKMVCALDRDEIEEFFEKNPRMKKWIQVFGKVEELNQFRDY